MTDNTAIPRLKRDYKDLIKNPLSNIRACPSSDNILLWYYVLIGNEDSPFKGGYYFGTIKFTKEFPFKPPHYTMHSENGRFIAGRDICTTNSNYHKESWNPLWSVSGILTGFVAFFHDLTQKNFLGSYQPQQKETFLKFAKESKHQIIDAQHIKDLFPDIIEQIQAEINGEKPPTHVLPFPPEYYETIKKAEEERKAIEIESKLNEEELVYDSDVSSDNEVDEE